MICQINLRNFIYKTTMDLYDIFSLQNKMTHLCQTEQRCKYPLKQCKIL